MVVKFSLRVKVFSYPFVFTVTLPLFFVVCFTFAEEPL